MSKRGENIYKRKDGRWEGRYWKGRRVNGSIKYGYIYGKSYYEVKHKLIDYKAYYQDQLLVNKNYGVTFEEWMECWLHEKKERVKQSTYAHYNNKMRYYILPLLDGYLISDIKTYEIEKLLNNLMKQGLNPSTVKMLISLLKQCLSAAQKKEILSSNPCEEIQLPKVPKRKVQALTQMEQLKLEEMALSEEHSNGLPIFLALQTGMRIGEISALQWKDIDFEKGTIYVRHTYQRIGKTIESHAKTKLILGAPKSEASIRVIPMTNRLYAVLKEHSKQKESSFVFSVNGHPREPRLITYHFQRIMKKAGLSDRHFHQLRHTFATRCNESTSDITSLSVLMGHHSTKMTLDIYTDSLLEQRIKVIEQMEQKEVSSTYT